MNNWFKDMVLVYFFESDCIKFKKSDCVVKSIWSCDCIMFKKNILCYCWQVRASVIPCCVLLLPCTDSRNSSSREICLHSLLGRYQMVLYFNSFSFVKCYLFVYLQCLFKLDQDIKKHIYVLYIIPL